MPTRFIIFIVVALAQLYIPVKIILESENVIHTGKEYRFKTIPVDPNDIFRGKYVQLSFEANEFPAKDLTTWNSGQIMYVELGTDTEGYAKVIDIHQSPPAEDVDYVEVIVNYTTNEKIVFTYPFDRFYMEESKAPEAEKIYRESQRNRTQTTYALVSVKNGIAILKDVYIDDIPIRELVTGQ